MTKLPTGCVTLEEHASLPALGDDHPSYDGIWKTFPEARSRLRDLAYGRLADMDAGNVDIQVISQVTGIANNRDEQSCRLANDQLAAAIKQAPTRLRGFAVLYMGNPRSASLELERCVTQHGFLGAMIDNHLPDMTHFDDERFWAVFEAAERLDVPVYFHPAPPSIEVVRNRFDGNYPHSVALGLSTGNWGWHENEGLHILKLFGAGLFQRLPRLKLIIGHMGEMLPMMIDRVDSASFFRQAGLGDFRQVWENNIWVTTSGMFSVRTLEMLLKVTPFNHVLYSVDTPFLESTRGWRFVEEIAERGFLSDDELQRFVSGNARKLFKLDYS